ncbi:hypothetical protein [Psychrobacter sp. ANT_WB68]|nr:hypothetical protein [Psychrobacter sp. ANT_WB68]
MVVFIDKKALFGSKLVVIISDVVGRFIDRQLIDIVLITVK